MNRSSICLLFASLLLFAASTHAQSVQDNWHQWRGPEANGVSRTAKPPLKWSEDKNIQWKAEIPGQGSSTPIIWGDKVFLLTAINTGKVDPSLPKPEDQPDRVFGIKFPNTFYQFVVLCLDRKTGKEVWRHLATERVPHEGTHNDNDFASSSPIVDGNHLYCSFGSAGVYCYTLNGQKVWERDLGKAHMGASLGEGSSPVVYDGKMVLVRDHSRQSHIHVLDAKTGETIWEKERDEPNTWATPRVLETNGKTQVITCGENLVRSYDLENGEIIWQCGGLSKNAIPCPVVQDGVVYCMSGYQGYSVLAISLSSVEDVSGSDSVQWSKEAGTPYIPSPLLYDDLLYYNQSNQAILTCLEASTGNAVIDRKRLSGVSNLYASPVGADGRVYLVGRNGTTLVLKRSKEFEVLAENELADRVDSSPALAGNQLYLRGAKYLYCIAE